MRPRDLKKGIHSENYDFSFSEFILPTPVSADVYCYYWYGGTQNI